MKKNIQETEYKGIAKIEEGEIIVIPRLNKILKERNMTQQQLADLSGVRQDAISRFDRQDKHKTEHLFRIAKALDISPLDLFVVIEN